MTENIYPIYDQMMSRADKELLLHQHGLMVWFTGLSGSGKSTIAMGVERELHKRGILCRILDGDNIRAGINSNLGFSSEDRMENIRRIAEIGKLFVQTGVVTLACFVSPTNDVRRLARDIIGKEDYKEVFVCTPLEVCERRDVKGLYAKARKGVVKNFTGISAPFEVPENPILKIDTSIISLEDSVNRVVEMILSFQTKK
jgi:adenylylsulfate kinase